MTTKLDILFGESKNSYDFSVDFIRSYDQRINNIYLMSTASVSVLLLITTFFYNIISGLVEKSDMNIYRILIIVVVVVSFFYSLWSFIAVLRKAYKVLKNKKIYSIDMEKIYDDFKSSTKTKNDLLEQLIVQINDHYKKNIDVLENIWTDYEVATDNLNRGVTFLSLFVVSSLILMFSFMIGG